MFPMENLNKTPTPQPTLKPTLNQHLNKRYLTLTWVKIL